MKLGIIQYPSPILRTPCRDVNVHDQVEVVTTHILIQDMIETMNDVKGLGLAANQVNHSICLFVMKIDETRTIVCINPTMVAHGEEVLFQAEACLSLPGTAAPTKRFEWVTLSFYGEDWVQREDRFEGMQAFAVQHEMDHLSGKLYIDQLGPLRKEMTLARHKKFLRMRGDL